MKGLLTQSNVYFLFWCLYLLQGTLYKSGSSLSVMLIAIILLMSSYHFYKVMSRRNRPKYFIGLIALVIMFSIYGLLLFITDGQRTIGIVLRPLTINYLKNLLISLLPIFSCFYFSKKGLINRKTLLYWVPIFLIVAIFQYYRKQREEYEALLIDRDGITNNAGYIMLSLIPCMYVFKKRWIQIIGIAICFLFVLFGMKRGAILVAIVAVIVYIYQNMRILSKSRKYIFLVGIIVLGALAFRYLEGSLFQNDYFNQRIEKTLEGNSSGRDELYEDFVTAYFDRFNTLQQLVGIGANGTIKISRNYAHNDWLEILINQGLLGLIVFASYWILFYKTTKDKRIPTRSRNLLILIFIMTLLRSFFSMSIGGNTIYIASVLGLALTGGLDER